MTSIAPLIFRIASWPMDTIEDLRSPLFAAEMDRALARRSAIQGRSASLSSMLYEEVPRLGRGERRAALRVRRALHRSTDPVSRADMGVLMGSFELAQGAKELLGADDAERLSLQCQLVRLRNLYQAALDREVEALARIARQPKFRKALAVASLSTSEAWEQGLRGSGCLENWRLRATLLNYVMRSVGRATPNGLWAAVAMEDLSDAAQPIKIRSTEPRVFVKPDVNVFFNLFSAASSPENYRRAIFLRCNPTLTEVAHGEYLYAHCRNDSWVITRSLDDGTIARLRKSLPDSDVADFEQLRAAAGISDEALDRLYIAGVLWPACDREGIHEDAWAALEGLVACLRPAERHKWQELILELHGICSSLESAYDDIGLEQLHLQLGRARRNVNRLAAHYGAEPSPADRNVLIFDGTAPFQIAVSRAFREQIFGAVRRCWEFDRGGIGEASARDARLSMAENEGAARVMALAGLSTQRAGADTAREIHVSDGAVAGSWEESLEGIHNQDLRNRCQGILQNWTADLEGAAGKSVHRVGLAAPDQICPMGPGAALVMPGITPEGISVRVGSIAPDWCAFYGRFHHLFRATGQMTFREWIEQAKAFVESRGVVLGDVIVRGAHDRNAALRPSVGTARLDPLGSTLSGMTAQCHATEPITLQDESGRQVFPVLHSAVETSKADPWSRWLADLERHAGRMTLLAPQPPLGLELTSWKHTPRLVLDSATVIAPERWWCPTEVAEQLRTSVGFDRFLAWRSWVRHGAMPERMYAQHGDVGTESLLLADSLLSVEVLGRALSQSDAPLRLQEMFFGDAGLWLRDEGGRKYMAEMALAWAGDPMFWAK